MLIHHKFVDVLRGASTEIPLQLVDATAEEARRCAELINDAEKFDFGDLHLEASPDDPVLGLIPHLTLDEQEAWLEGLLPAPAPLCWYEFTLNGWRSGLLIVVDGTAWKFTRLDWAQSLMFDGHWSILDRKDNDLCKVKVECGPTVRHVVQNSRYGESMFGMIPYLGLYLTLLLNSRSTEVRTERAPERLNRARVKRGVTPLADHRVVRIVPEAYLRARRAEIGSTRLAPRLHWRRSHIRTLHRGSGAERRILIPRCLVSAASEAEVSHEYRINP